MSDDDQSRIEREIAPLVEALRKAGFQPFCSCGGHGGVTGLDFTNSPLVNIVYPGQRRHKQLEYFAQDIDIKILSDGCILSICYPVRGAKQSLSENVSVFAKALAKL